MEEFYACCRFFAPRFSAVPFVFFPKKVTEIYQSLLLDRFKYPVCIDKEDSLNKLNNFPHNMAFQTFLLNKNNKVMAIGNPILNPKIKELYMKIIQGEEIVQANEDNLMTNVSIDTRSLFLVILIGKKSKELFLH